jgi:hypothetical protein
MTRRALFHLGAGLPSHAPVAAVCPGVLWYNRSRMAETTTLESLARLVTKGFASADKKFTALAEDIAAVEKRLDARLDKSDAKIDSVGSTLAGKIDHLGAKLTRFEESEIDKRLQLEVRVAAIEKHLGIDKKIAA